MKITKYKEVICGVLILFFSIVIGVIVSIIVVENGMKSNASNDGWLGFIGGTFGSFLSGIMAIYVLYVNRKDAKKEIQRSEHILIYQQKKALLDDVCTLLAKLIGIAESESYDHEEQKNIARATCLLIELKIGKIDSFGILLKEIQAYNGIFVQGKCDSQTRQKALKMSRQHLMEIMQDLMVTYISEEVSRGK